METQNAETPTQDVASTSNDSYQVDANNPYYHYDYNQYYANWNTASTVSSKPRPARKQVKKGSGPIRQEISDHSSDYNIWYHKKIGDRFDKEEKQKATTRCCITTDAGYTRADKSKKDSSICIYFARGLCTHGSDCHFYHRIPTIDDELKLDVMRDIFGRERHRNHREDMGGVGSFMQENRSLHVSGLKRQFLSEEILFRHFGEWGDVESVRIVWDKCVAYIKYKLRSSAEFAKESMQGQSLDNDELLIIKWSNEEVDPEEQEEYRATLRAAAAQKRAQQAYYDYYTQYQQNQNYQQAELNVDTDSNAYPDTDLQYNSAHDYSNSNQVIGKWLQTLGLEEYKDAILAAGYFDLQSLEQLDDFGLDAIGVIKLDHRKALLDAVNKLKTKPQENSEKVEQKSNE